MCDIVACFKTLHRRQTDPPEKYTFGANVIKPFTVVIYEFLL
jgi:hypothetical protein